MRNANLLDIIESLLENPSSIKNIIWPKAIAQVEEIRNNVITIENYSFNLTEIHFNLEDNIDSFQENLYFLDETLSNHPINSQEQLDNLIIVINNMLDYITNNKNDILTLEWVKLHNVKNSFRAIQNIIKSEIKLSSSWLEQTKKHYSQVYWYIIPNLPSSVNTELQTEFLSNLNFDNFDNNNKKLFINMIQDLRNICQQVIENTDNFKNLNELELNELHYSLEKLLNIINLKLNELINRKQANLDNLGLPKSSLVTMIKIVDKSKEKVIWAIKRKKVEKKIKNHIESFPNLEKEILIKDINLYKNFIAEIHNIYNFISLNNDILSEIDKEYIIEFKIFLEEIKEKLNYVISQGNPNNTDYLKFLFPANRVLTIIKSLIERLDTYSTPIKI